MLSYIISCFTLYNFLVYLGLNLVIILWAYSTTRYLNHIDEKVHKKYEAFRRTDMKDITFLRLIFPGKSILNH